MIEILGLTDPMIICGYLGCILITIICVIYGAINWNKE
ncbi:symporter small accessory protein [Methanosphaera sp. WGK6]